MGDAQPALTPRADALLGWWARRRRELPWRATRDPWAVLVCEVMSHQTQAARVAQRWGPFMDEFPTASACARAGRGAVIRAWSGLGYNRRALQLHATAVAVTEHHGGVLPDDLAGLAALPGVGPYTARAVLAFAHGHDVGVVDTNAARVLARWSGRPLARRDAQDLADRCVPPGQGWEWNQAVLDLGASLCRRRRVDCAGCPVRSWCAWAGSDALADPAEGSFGVGRPQQPFAGSDRQGRGRLMAALAAGPVDPAALAGVTGWPDDPARAQRVAAALVGEGLAVRDGDLLVLP